MKNEAFAPTPELLAKMDAWWRAANYLSACQLYLLDDPLLRRRLTERDIKKKIVGHWGTVPGQNFIYTHLNRVINEYDLDMIYLSGPGHGGNAMVAQDYLDGSYTDVYPNITRDAAGMQRLFKQFSFPGGIPSHVAPETPGSIHEGGELGYSLAHAFGAVLDNPDLIAACVVGDGEAETGPLATSWHGNKFMNPITDGAVLPILHLNGFKIANPTIFSRMSHEEVECFFRGCGWEPRFVEGDEPETMHQQMAAAVDWAIREIKRIQRTARESGKASRPRWPMLVLRTPKGWTGPKEVDGNAIEGSWRAHQVPISMGADESKHLPLLEQWLRSYKPEELFNEDGTPVELIASFPPKGEHRMGANPHANGGLLLRDLRTPDFRDYAVDIPAPGEVEAQDMYVLGTYVRDVMKLNMESRNFRIFAPDETASNRLSPVFEVTGRRWVAEATDNDEFLDPDGRVMDSMLSEHMCEGWLEGYLLTGRHGFFNSYEAFIRIVDSMVAQHAKWLKVCNQLPWRQDIASLNYVLASNVWQQDHNGFTHQDPGFLDHVSNKKADVVRISNKVRYGLLAAALILSAATGTAAFEAVSPQAWIWRDLVFGTGLAALSAASAVFALDLALMKHGWCGHLCPLGAFWSLVGRLTRSPVVRVSFDDAACNRCGDCLRACPEPHVIRFASLKETGRIPAGDCLNCGRCIEACGENALKFRIGPAPRIRTSSDTHQGENHHD